MSRIANKVNQSADMGYVAVSAPVLPGERNRLNAAFRPAGYRTRAEFIRDAIMDAVEQVEELKGGPEVLAALESDRVARLGRKE